MAGGKTTQWANDILSILFKGSNIANIMDNAASSPLTNLYISLHVADPGASGNQTSSETNYVDYARQPVVRSSGGWIVTTNSATLASQLDFPDPGVGTSPQVITHWGIGTDATGTGKLLYRGPVFPNVPVSYGVTGPALKDDSVIVES